MTTGAVAALFARVRAIDLRWRYGLRVTVAALAAFVVARGLGLPLNGLWAVLTAIVVSQVSVGGSLRATIEYNVGTLGGAIYAVVVGLATPHTTPVWQAIALAVAVGPLAVAAALSPSFRVAPFSAVLVLLIGVQLGESPLISAATRVLEVAIGGAVAVAVSLLVFPERARGLGLDAAARILNQMADLLPSLLGRVARASDGADYRQAQADLGRSVTRFQGLADEAKQERMLSLAHAPDAASLARMLLRIRHDFVMLGRATAERFPEAIAGPLEQPLSRFGEAAAEFLRGCAVSIAGRRPAPAVASAEAALAAYDEAIGGLRRDGLTRAMSTPELERLFGLEFALEQTCRDLADLAPLIDEHGGAVARSRS